MDGSSAYYNQHMYPHETYTSVSPVTAGYPGSQPPACVYAQTINHHGGGYGGHNMAVVEGVLRGTDSPNSIPQHMQHHQQQGIPVTLGHGAMSNTTPAHMQNAHLTASSMTQVSQPPPAHQPQSVQINSQTGGVGSTTQGGNNQNNQNNHLQFPWMKTTKSHAAQWKAQWPAFIASRSSVLEIF
ncbi:hypothetical protein CHS0354_006605 [Potamilus streckersoni]|uniref:Uncharacterized protein n=1 Tax=Potamilus streckersoni TaxID=2493646 RepID=A0AAE0SWG1_9BIVA|nr:hypothetical protein CHS0354_006605 [Potamilus streckersoni]